MTGGGGNGTAVRGEEAQLGAALRLVGRGLLRELWTPAPMALPPLARPRWLRWAPHVLVCWIMVGSTLSNIDQFGIRYHLGVPLGAFLAVVQGAAMLLALWRPVPAFWLSLADMVLVAVLARPWLATQPGGGTVELPGVGPSLAAHPAAEWPWAGPSVVAHATVLLLFALRGPTAAVAVAAGLSALAGPGVQRFANDVMRYSSTTGLAAIVFVAVALLGVALRGRREARTQLVVQEEITADERARRALLEERSRIARELHDVVAHHMSVISIQAQVAPHLVKDPPDELRENLEGIRSNALEALTELRRVLGVLRAGHPDEPADAADPGTAAAPQRPQPTLARLDALVENTRAAGLTVTTLATGERRALPPGVELSAYRIVQEALSNALRHAPGSTVEVALDHVRDGLGLRITNTAPAAAPPESPGAGHGLLGMRERAAMLGGTLRAGPVPETGGFEIRAFLPTTAPTTPPHSTGDDR